MALGLVALAACGGGAQLITAVDVLTFTATSQVTANSPMKFSTTVTLKNGTTGAVSFAPSCAIPRVLVYAAAARTGTPIWDSNTRTPPPACAAVITTLTPGQSTSYTLTATGAEALGSTGTAGTYYLVDEVTLDGFSTRTDAGQLAIAR
jgi:hypothetical protein